MYKAWYRKWRPTNFDEVCGQEQVTDILKYQVANHKTSHAYLFCGSRGTGKTSCAKILARAVNCEHPVHGNPCNECVACKSILNGLSTDVIEIDAASNNGVDNVRDIKEEINFTPAELTYRVYIIDEVHMMSGSAFNAILKTLEEPPGHVIFILATTEMQKLPSTIVSRCQRYDFRRLPTAVLMDRMHHIAATEGIELEDSGALVIARMAQGGMRDTVSLLELCAGAKKKIDYDLVISILGAGNRDGVLRLVRAVAQKDYRSILAEISEVVMASKDLAVYWQELIDVYRDMLICKTSGNVGEYLDMTDAEVQTLKDVTALFSAEALIYHSKLLEEALAKMQRGGFTKRSCAEITLIRMCQPKLSTQTEALLARIAKLEEEVTYLRLGIKTDEPGKKSEADPENVVGAESTVATRQETAPAMSTDSVAAKEAYLPMPGWANVVEQLIAQKGAIAGFLQNTRAFRTPAGGYMICTSSDFSAKMLSRPEILTLMKNLISAQEGKNITTMPFDVVGESKTAGMNLLDELVRDLEE